MGLATMPGGNQCKSIDNQAMAGRQSRGSYLKVDSKKARALATEMQITLMTRTPYTISHLGCLCSAKGLHANIYLRTSWILHLKLCRLAMHCRQREDTKVVTPQCIAASAIVSYSYLYTEATHHTV